MKYIRTKDGRIITLKDELINNADLWVVGGKENILKIADTIEELCDEFVEVWQSGDLVCHSKINIYSKRAMNEYNKYRKGTSVIYGAIWTDKGLIYVAKMNEKGELELL